MTQLIKSLNTLIKVSEVHFGFANCCLPKNAETAYFNGELIDWCFNCNTCSFNKENKTILLEVLNGRVDKST